MASTMIGKRAVVIGAGMGGLAAAGGIARHFEQVDVLERDTLPSGPIHRPGTPQGRHVHALAMSGLLALEELFPGFQRDLMQSGAVPLKVGLDTRVERPGYDPFPQRDLGYVSQAASRPAIEFTLRRRVESLANLTVRQNCRVRELMASPSGARITGLRFEDADGTSETLSADFIVDASGRGAPTLALLQSIGMPLPEETTIGIDLGYSSCAFDRLDDVPSDCKAIMTFGQPPADKRGALLFPIEGDRWLLTAVGRLGVVPPGDYDGLLAYTRGFRTPTIYNAIKNAKRPVEIVRHGFTESVHRHFERLEIFPRGLLPIADSICRFNPVYGQGMSVAAQEACLLRKLLDRLAGEHDPLAELTQAFFAEVQAVIDTPWSVATQDFAFPQTRGRRPADLETRLKFGAAVIRVAAEDAAVQKLFAEVQNLLKPRSVYEEDPAVLKRITAMMASPSNAALAWSR